jgi:putative transposase
MGDNTIPSSLQLASGRVAQEYNQRKKRQGAFWEDRYHATMIESGEHLLRCLVYIDLNMVRAGVVQHPEQWMHSGYNEIQKPRRKCVLIDYGALGRLAGYDGFRHFQRAHRNWVEAAIVETGLCREAHWTEAIAVGSKSYVSRVKKELKSKATGRQVYDSIRGAELKETRISYNALLGPEKSDIGAENTIILDVK